MNILSKCVQIEKSVKYEREKKKKEQKGKSHIYIPLLPATRLVQHELRTHPRTPNSPIHKKHHIMISLAAPPIPSNPILVNPKRTLSFTQPRCSHILTTPRHGLTLFPLHPTTTPLVQHQYQPSSPAQSVRTFRPERSIHSDPLKVSPLSSISLPPPPLA